VFKALRQRKTVTWDVGETGITVDALKQRVEGYIRIGAEYWKAKSDIPIDAGQKVNVIRREGPVLIVEPQKES
jgi:membrane-bound ClpP family serine protease